MLKRIFIFSWLLSGILSILKLTCLPELSYFIIFLPIIAFIILIIIAIFLGYYIAKKWDL